ncbi:MAG: delta-60 repeat domain-containing protein, partial [Limisphaerales bacterium]
MAKQPYLRLFFVIGMLLSFTAPVTAQQAGSIDTTFNSSTFTSPNTIPSVESMFLEPDGKLYVAGLFSSISNANRMRIARLLPNGRVDTTFDPGMSADDAIFSVTQDAKGRVLIGGAFQRFNGVDYNRIARLNYDGALDPTFN